MQGTMGSAARDKIGPVKIRVNECPLLVLSGHPSCAAHVRFWGKADMNAEKLRANLRGFILNLFIVS